LMAVRRRLMKAVFFFMDESREPCTANTSVRAVSAKSVGKTRAI